MHWIQRHILKQLATSEACRYKDLKPEGVEGNLFMYHLKQLMTEKYVAKKDSLYALTKSGKKFVGGMSLETGNPTILPRLFVMLYAKNGKGEILLYKWNRQPYLDHVSLPFSRIRYGQTIQEAAEQNLQNKTNLKGELKNRGLVNVVVKKSGEISTHYIAHIFEFKNANGEPTADGLTGQPFWGNLEDFDVSDLVNGTEEIIKSLKAEKEPIFNEISINS